MPQTMLDDMKLYLGFSEADAALLSRIRPAIEPILDGVADEFYHTLSRHPGARAVFADNDERIRGLRRTLRIWLQELFSGRYDENYFEQRCNIGRVHVRVNLPQHYMFTAMNVIRISLMREMANLDLPDRQAAMAAVQKILDMELAIMNQTYREDLVDRIQNLEQRRFEQRLSESEHLATVGGLAASLAHEIKNPLAGISGAIQIIRSTLEAEHPHREIIDEILRQIDRLDNAVRDLLIYARPKPPAKAEVDLNELLSRVLKVLKEAPSFRALTINREGSEMPIPLMIDETQLQQVLINLILNAAHASRDNGEVICRVKDAHHAARIEIQDHGIGIPREILNRVWEPFFTTKAKGTGLGLSICKRIIEAHGGTIEILSEFGNGTLVSIDLPKTAKHPQDRKNP